MRSFLLSAFCLAMLLFIQPDAAHATPPNPGDPTPCGSCNSNVVWPKLPLACLPSRAERWKTAADMQPCHCPSPDHCPDVKALEGKDITFYVSWNPLGGGSRSCEVKGDSVPDIDAIIASGHLFGSKQQVFDAIGQAVADQCGFEMRDTHGDYWSFSVTVGIVSNQNLLDWVNDTLEMPVELAVRCCDSVCPMGLTPTIKDVEVEITEIVGEGHGNQPDCDKYTKLLSDAEAKLVVDQKTADDAAKNAKDKCEEPNGAPGAACDAAQKTAHDAAVTVTEDLNEVDTLTKAKTAACDMPKQVKKKITIQTVSCGATATYSREGCMSEGTQITMADGTTKNVEDVKVGDEVKGNEGAAKVIATSRFTQKEDFFYSINDGQATFTVEHPVLTKGGWKSVDPKITSTKTSGTKIIGKLQVGDKVLTKDGEVEVKSIEKKKSEGTVSAYNLKVERDGSIIANGFIIKGFVQMQMHY